MKNYTPTYTDISEWQEKVYQNTGGTRRKKILINPENEQQYFFKGSKELETGEIRYPTEFWSEIVSSKIGQYLGFNLLDYNIGYRSSDKQKIGCLSRSMVDESESRLVEGKTYLTGYNPSYNPDDDKTDYTFQFITRALGVFTQNHYLSHFIEMLIFDSIISNSDRHQENWGFIIDFKKAIEDFKKESKNKEKKLFKRIKLKLLSIVQKNLPDEEDFDAILLTQSIMTHTNFSPVYDSGCCLGREFSDEKVDRLLKDSQMLAGYINKGTSEIHWEGSKKKKNHFELIELLHKEHRQVITKVIDRVKQRFQEQDIAEIVNSIDSKLPEELSQHKLTTQRKELMIKLITLRSNKLFQL